MHRQISWGSALLDCHAFYDFHHFDLFCRSSTFSCWLFCHYSWVSYTHFRTFLPPTSAFFVPSPDSTWHYSFYACELHWQLPLSKLTSALFLWRVLQACCEFTAHLALPIVPNLHDGNLTIFNSAEIHKRHWMSHNAEKSHSLRLVGNWIGSSIAFLTFWSGVRWIQQNLHFLKSPRFLVILSLNLTDEIERSRGRAKV